MARRPPVTAPCVVCSYAVGEACELPASKVSRVVIEGHTLRLCRAHAAWVATSMPRTFEELRALFLEAESRRSVIERRGVEDRRMFPPRPEGRRMPGGRRVADAPQ